MDKSEYTDSLTQDELNQLTTQPIERTFQDSDTDTHFPKDTFNLSSSELYERGKSLLFSSGFLLKLDASSDRALHSVYRLTHPSKLKGIAYPDSFKYWKKLSTKEDRQLLERTIKNWDNELVKFWFPLLTKWTQKNTISQLQSYAEVLIREEIEDIELNQDGFNLGLNPMCAGMPFVDSQEFTLDAYPLTFLPAKSWFTPELHKLTPKDILSIFPENELPLFQLILGRALVGRSGNIVPGTYTPLEHTSRMAALVQSEAGLGKSDTFSKGIFSALRKVGYEVAVAGGTLDPKFSTPKTYTSHILYVDDTSEDKLTGILKSEGSKRIITGDKILVEEKFKMPLPVYANCVPIICLNQLNEYASLKMDSGNADRFHVFSLHTKEEIETLPLEVCGEVSPSRSPKQHLSWLSKKFNVSVDTLWLYLCRLCADDFYETITNDNPESLYLEVQKRKQLLKHSWGSNIVERVTYLVYFLASISESNVTSKAVFETITHVNPQRLAINLSMLVDLTSVYRHTVIKILRKDYEKNKTENHPYLLLNQIIPQSVSKINDKLRSIPHPETLEAWVVFYSELDTTIGFQFTPQPLRITQTWDHVLRSKAFLDGIIKETMQELVDEGMKKLETCVSKTFVN